MPIVNKAGSVNFLSSPDNLTPGGIAKSNTNGAVLHFIRDKVSILATDSNTSTYRLARLPSNAILKEVVYENSALTGGSSYSLGFYDVPEVNNGAVISASALASAVSLVSASSGFGSNGMSNVSIDNKEKQIWELAGLTSDPKKLIDIAFVANTASTVAGTISLSIAYSLV